MPDWRLIDDLRRGTALQQRAWTVVADLGLMQVLAPFDPALVSTIRVGLEVQDSDLDVICCAPEASAFEGVVRAAYGDRLDFSLRRWPAAVVASFGAGGFQVELFAAPDPVERQNAWRHLSMMDRLLNVLGPSFAAEMRRLRADGHKMEVAAARALGRGGDPYAAVLELEGLDDGELRRLWRAGEKGDTA